VALSVLISKQIFFQTLTKGSEANIRHRQRKTGPSVSKSFPSIQTFIALKQEIAGFVNVSDKVPRRREFRQCLCVRPLTASSFTSH
jgi:hypothetical protein